MAADFKTWLHQKGLERHADLLIEQEIDLSVLPDLSDAELIELGLPLGARKKLLRAAASLREQLGLADAHATTVTDTPQAERRQLTVMFIDLIASTALSSRLDPEDMRAILTQYQNAVAGVITRYEGFVAKYMGDGVLAYFGWPSAHEDEAERAVRAGLEITQSVAKLITPDNTPLSCRIGIATGLVVVGDMIGDGAAQEQAVIGDAPNLAARMQALARPDHIVIAESTKKLLGGRFDLSDPRVRIIKGIDGAVTCFEVTRERTCVDARLNASTILGSAWACGQVRSCVRPQRCGFTSAAGPYGDMQIRSNSVTRARRRFVRKLVFLIRSLDRVPLRFPRPAHIPDVILAA